jgi:hypothetical protein
LWTTHEERRIVATRVLHLAFSGVFTMGLSEYAALLVLLHNGWKARVVRKGNRFLVTKTRGGGGR